MAWKLLKMVCRLYSGWIQRYRTIRSLPLRRLEKKDAGPETAAPKEGDHSPVQLQIADSQHI